MINLSNEIALIIECCKEDQDQNAITKYINNISDWDKFRKLSYTHGVFPLIYKTLKNYSIQQEQLQQLQQTNLEIVKKNMLLTSELIKVMQLLEDNGIEALAFKGPVLSQMAYGDVVSRQYVDLDILVKEDDLKKTYNLFLQNEYDTKIESEYLDNELFKQKNSDIQFISQKSNVLIEVHWKLFRSNFANKIDLTKTLYMSNLCNLNGQNIKVFSNEVLFVYLCMHGSKHGWERIEWLVDIQRFLANYENLDWNKIYNLAKMLECTLMVSLGLYLCNKYFATDILTTNFSIKSPIIKKLELQTIHYWNDSLVKQSEVERNYKKFIYHYVLNDTLYLKMKFVFNTSFSINNGDISTINLPKGLYFMYYFIKPIRLMSKYFSKIFK